MDCSEPVHSSVLGIHISKERNMLVASILSDHWLKSMESILYIQMAASYSPLI